MKIVAALIVLVLVLAGADSVFVVREGHGALLLQLGRISSGALAPGLHFKIPFAQQVDMYDTRAIVSESEPERYQTADGEAVDVGFYARWRVADPDAYYRATAGEELQATQQMMPLIRDALRSQVQAHELRDVIAGDGAISTRLRTLVDRETRTRLGMEILDVGIERVEFPDEAADAVYKRMQANAKSRSAALRADAEAQASDIRAAGEHKAQELLGQALQDAAATRGDADAQAAKIHAQTSAQDPQFFAFWSSLEAYRAAFGSGRAVIVLDRDSPFLKEFGGANATNK
ncbi:MAG TPA: protease modulator HflC [Rhodanobacteraceae bacterium]|nr:protease modulator HflC [Rhodanobacteraceae bacterium]